MSERFVAVALARYEAEETHELSIQKNERLSVLDATHNWWKVR